MRSAPALVAVDDLVVEYTTGQNTVRPVDGFTMRAARASLVALSGPSGSGKTTLLSVLSGMTEAGAGRVRVDGVDVRALSGTDLAKYRRHTVGIVFQSFNLIHSLNARENVAAPLLITGTHRKVALARADDLLQQVGLTGRGRHKPIELSGGEQQRVAIARALVGDPAVVLADEPTANLDHVNAESVVGLLQHLRDRGRTIIISTHDDRVLSAMDHVVAMSSDRTVAAPLAPAQHTPTDDTAEVTVVREASLVLSGAIRAAPRAESKSVRLPCEP